MPVDIIPVVLGIIVIVFVAVVILVTVVPLAMPVPAVTVIPGSTLVIVEITKVFVFDIAPLVNDAVVLTPTPVTRL